MARILIADDETAVREVMKHACMMDGHEVRESVDAFTTVSEYAACAPDLLILDLVMPGGGGTYVLAQLGAGAAKVCPILVVSGFVADMGDAVRASPLVTTILEKPFSIETLRATVRNVLTSAGLS